MEPNNPDRILLRANELKESVGHDHIEPCESTNPRHGRVALPAGLNAGNLW
jgi:hypothetical protein